eukprot:m.726849 g.726849  ORF g.726849 m.726849 type:complete len:297 (+) comp23030_c0_seq1:492-1382(+)
MTILPCGEWDRCCGHTVHIKWERVFTFASYAGIVFYRQRKNEQENRPSDLPSGHTISCVANPVYRKQVHVGMPVQTSDHKTEGPVYEAGTVLYSTPGGEGCYGADNTSAMYADSAQPSYLNPYAAQPADGDRPATVYHAGFVPRTANHPGNSAPSNEPTTYHTGNGDTPNGPTTYHTVSMATDEVGAPASAPSTAPVYDRMPDVQVASNYQGLTPTYGVNDFQSNSDEPHVYATRTKAETVADTDGRSLARSAQTDTDDGKSPATYTRAMEDSGEYEVPKDNDAPAVCFESFCVRC